MRRVYLNELLTLQRTVCLNHDIFHYVVRVLRCRDGERLTVFNGDGFDYTAVLQFNGKKSASIYVEEKTPNHNESPLHITLLQGLSKGDRMDIVMQKAVELGVNAIIPITTEFCAVKLDEKRTQKKIQHWQSIMMSACEQSERAVLPTLQTLTPFTDAINMVDAEIKWLLHPHTDDKAALAADTVRRVAICIGPEGGFSPSEVHSAVAAGFVAKSLGKRILRTETAAIAALSLCQQLWGDWQI